MEFHDIANIFPMMGEVELQQLAADIQANGQREPIWTHDGKIIDGRNRFKACALAGVEPQFSEWDGQGSLLSFVVSLNLHRRHLSDSQRASIAARLATMKQGQRTDLSPIGERLSQQEAADLLNVGKRSVERASDVQEAGVPELVSAMDAGSVAVSAAAELISLPAAEQQRIVEAGPVAVRETAKQIKDDKANEKQEVSRLAPLMTSNSPEWYTPEKIISRVHKAMGRITLDPCSSAEANKIVQATRFYTFQDNGLCQDWNGRVFMNPPYGDTIGLWVKKLLDEFGASRIEQAIALLPARTDTAWFRSLRHFPRCFISGRIKFEGPDADGNSAPFPSCAFALGCDLDRFIEAFQGAGDVYQLIEKEV